MHPVGDPCGARKRAIAAASEVSSSFNACLGSCACISVRSERAHAANVPTQAAATIEDRVWVSFVKAFSGSPRLLASNWRGTLAIQSESKASE